MPNSLSELHTLHAWEDNQITERCTQGEYAGKVLQFKLVDKDGAINLSNCLVQYAVTRPDKTEDLLDCIVDNGVVKCNLTYSVTSVVGLVHGEVRVIGSNDSGIIKFYGANLRVYKGVSDETAEQSDEFTALVAALRKVVALDISDVVAEMDELNNGNLPNGINPVASGNLKTYLEGKYQEYLQARFTGFSYAHDTHSSGYDDETNPVDVYDDGGVYIDNATDIMKMYCVKNSNGARVGILFCVRTSGYNYDTQVKMDAYGNITTRVKTQESGEANYTWKNWTPVGTTRNIQDGAVTTAKLADGSVTNRKLADGAVAEEKLSQIVREKINGLDSETVVQATNEYLDQHPELITTVDDNELSINKLQKGTLGFVTPQMFINEVLNPNSDTQLIQAAIDYASNSVDSVYVFLPAKTYLIGGIKISKPIKIVGAGQNKTILKELSSETETIEGFDNNNEPVSYTSENDFLDALLTIDITNMSGETKNYCTVSDLSFEGDRVTVNNESVAVTYIVKSQTIEGAPTEYIYEEKSKNGISLRHAERVVLNNISVYRAGVHGIRLTTYSRDCKMSNITVRASASHGLRQEGYGNSVVNIESSQNVGDGINITSGGCQISNAKSWGNRGNGVCVSGASYCMISNVNSQQNRCCGLKITNGYRNDTPVISTYNVITAFQSVGNNFSANSSNNTVNILDNQPQKQYANSSGFYIAGRDNIIQGVDVRANWTNNWYGLEKCAVYVSQDSINNKIDVVCSEGETALFGIYNDPMFSTIGFDVSTMLIILNNNNHININGFNGSADENINQNIYSKKEINEMFGIVNAELLFEENKYLITNVADGAKINLSAFVANESYHVSKTEVTAGEKFIINAYGGNQALAWAFFESDGTKIQGSDSVAIVTNLLLTAPANAKYLIINDQKAKNINNICYQIKEIKNSTINSSSTHDTIPTSKAVYDAIQAAVQAALGGGAT